MSSSSITYTKYTKGRAFDSRYLEVLAPDRLALLLVLVLSLLLIKTIFRGGLLPGWDNPAHLVCSHLTARYFAPQLGPVSWDPYNNFGWPFNQYYNPGAYMLVPAVYWLALGSIDVAPIAALACIAAHPASQSGWTRG